ncbi:MAG TPA: HAD-IC family P-type ATPase [Bdellovibrionota bacterium]|nr:HAD-IC family P-type ATPase [Bdellovibrionota bacterium]
MRSGTVLTRECSNLAIAIIAVILVNGAFSFWQEFRAERALEALKGLLPEQVRCVRSGNMLQISASELVPGDILILREGDRVPADCRVLSASGFLVSMASLTGESSPQLLVADPDLEQTPYPHNFAPSGTTVTAGNARVVVTATGMHTEFGRVAHLAQATGDAMSPLQKEIVRLTRRIAILATLLGIVFFTMGQGSGLSIWVSLVFAIGIMVANVPEVELFLFSRWFFFVIN